MHLGVYVAWYFCNNLFYDRSVFHIVLKSIYFSLAEQNSCSKVWYFVRLDFRMNVSNGVLVVYYQNKRVNANRYEIKTLRGSITGPLFTDNQRVYLSISFGNLMMPDHKVVNNCSRKMGVVIFHIYYYVFVHACVCTSREVIWRLRF